MKQQIRELLRKADLAPTRRAPFLVRLNPYTGARRVRSILGPTLSDPISWQASDTPPVGRLADVFNQSEGAHKWIHYLPLYESIIPSSTPIRMLEIGVFRGGSLEMWRNYLHPESVIVGIDINSDCKRFDDPSNGINVRIGSQDDVYFLNAVAEEFGPFDVILDDGSHMSSHMINSFRHLYGSALAEYGIYIVEDLHCDYWTAYRDSSITFFDFIAVLIDAMHAHYQVVDSEHKFRTDDPDRVRSISVPLITPTIGSIEIYDSIAVIRKTKRDLPRTVMR